MSGDPFAPRPPLLGPFVQLVALAGVAWSLGLEQGAGLPVVLAVVVVGWVVHELLPPAFGTPTFLGLSLGVAAWRLGEDAGLVVGAGLVLAELATLPIRLAGRVALVALAGAAVAWARASEQLGVEDGALAVLGSMFMFRIVLVLLDPEARSVPRIERWSYFFQFPNVLFPLYPVVDWRTWLARRASSAELHRRGLRTIARGFWQLLAYRCVYHLALPADWEVSDATTLLWWMFASFGLYVRISGTFHVIVGLLQLFGRDLPRTHDHYLLATGFADHYRRVNLYWTRFLERMVFQPAWFALRRRRVPSAHVVAVGLTFAASWALHHWQAFWIRGQLDVTATDTTFWAVLGLLVAADTARVTSRPVASLKARGAYVLRSARVVATIVAMTALWSLWKSPTFGLWFARLGLLRGATTELLGLGALLAGAVVAGALVQSALDRPRVRAAGRWLSRDGVSVLGLGAAALVLAAPPPEQAPRWWRAARTALAGEHLSRGDEVMKTQGYYDDLLGAATVDPAALRRPDGWILFESSPFARPLPADLPYGVELVPSASGLFHGLPFSTNAHGMRDREYPVEKPPGTYRIALLGASPEMGQGVADDEVFAEIAEERLNRRSKGGRRYEILNFAVCARTLEGQVVDYERRVRAFSPDLVLVADHTSESMRLMWNLAQAAQLGRPIPEGFPDAERVFAGVDSWAAAQALVAPYARDVTRRLDERLVRAATADGARVAWLGVPVPSDAEQGDRESWREEEAVAAGMIAIDLEGAYAGHSDEELEVAPWDHHPNALAHRLLARRLVRELARRDEELGLGLAP